MKTVFKQHVSVFFFLFVFLFPLSLHAQTKSVASYNELLSSIREVRNASQTRIEQAVEQERVREAWETGKLIDEHILLHKERAEYGESIVIRLAKDLNTSETELRYMLQFAREYPIHRPADELSWSHYESLLALNDPQEREKVAKQAVREKWTRQRMREEVARAKIKKKPDAEPAPAVRPEKLPETKPGKPGTYRIYKMASGELAIDLGFSNHFQPAKKLKFKEGDIVSLQKRKLKKSKDTADALYTYEAKVLAVIDGDTIKAQVDLGFGFTTNQTLRLRGIDAPEIEGEDGKEAKTFLKSLLANQPRVLIKTVKSDKYDRYLVDLWIGNTYVNQKLLDEEFATRVEG